MKEKHIKWKDPIVETVYRYINAKPEEQHVHWRVPLVDKVHIYEPINRNPRRLESSETEVKGISHTFLG